MPLDSYIRVSRVGGREGDSYTTVEEQRRLINQADVEIGLEIVEEDVSGSRAVKDRGLEELIVRVEEGKSARMVGRSRIA